MFNTNSCDLAEPFLIYFISPENTRKPKVFRQFRGYKIGNVSITLVPMFPSVSVLSSIDGKHGDKGNYWREMG